MCISFSIQRNRFWKRGCHSSGNSQGREFFKVRELYFPELGNIDILKNSYNTADLIPLKAGFHMIADDRRRSQTIADRKSQIADDRKESCFHIIADDRKRSQSRMLHTFRTAELSKLHARCAGGKIAANNMADVEEEILLQANLFLLFIKLFWNSLGSGSRPDPEGSVFNRFR